MLLCLPTRPRKGGDGNGGFFYFKKVSPLGTPYLVLFPFYLLILFTKQCRSIFIEMKIVPKFLSKKFRVHLYLLAI